MAKSKNPWELEIQRRVKAHVEAQMLRRGINKAEVARRIGVSQSNLGRMLSGQRGMSAGVVLGVSRKFGIDGHVLLNEDPKPSPRVVPLRRR